MHVKCSVVFASISVFMCAKFVLAQGTTEISVGRGIDQRANTNDTLRDDFQPTTDVIVNAKVVPTSSSTEGELIEDTSSFSTHPTHLNSTLTDVNEVVKQYLKNSESEDHNIPVPNTTTKAESKSEDKDKNSERAPNSQATTEVGKTTSSEEEIFDSTVTEKYATYTVHMNDTDAIVNEANKYYIPGKNSTGYDSSNTTTSDVKLSRNITTEKTINESNKSSDVDEATRTKIILTTGFVDKNETVTDNTIMKMFDTFTSENSNLEDYNNNTSTLQTNESFLLNDDENSSTRYGSTEHINTETSISKVGLELPTTKENSGAESHETSTRISLENNDKISENTSKMNSESVNYISTGSFTTENNEVTTTDEKEETKSTTQATTFSNINISNSLPDHDVHIHHPDITDVENTTTISRNALETTPKQFNSLDKNDKIFENTGTMKSESVTYTSSVSFKTEINKNVEEQTKSTTDLTTLAFFNTGKSLLEHDLHFDHPGTSDVENTTTILRNESDITPKQSTSDNATNILSNASEFTTTESTIDMGNTTILRNASETTPTEGTEALQNTTTISLNAPELTTTERNNYLENTTTVLRNGSEITPKQSTTAVDNTTTLLRDTSEISPTERNNYLDNAGNILRNASKITTTESTTVVETTTIFATEQTTHPRKIIVSQKETTVKEKISSHAETTPVKRISFSTIDTNRNNPTQSKKTKEYTSSTTDYQTSILTSTLEDATTYKNKITETTILPIKSNTLAENEKPDETTLVPSIKMKDITVPIEQETSTLTTQLLTSAEAKTTTDSIIIETTTDTVMTTTRDILETCRDTSISYYEIHTGKTWVTIDWTLISMPIQFECQLKINIFCSSMDYFDWVISNRNSTTVVKDNRPISHIRGLSEFTNYSCTAVLFSDLDDQMILSTETLNVTTEKEVPSSIEVNITNITATNFTLQWKKPQKIPGNLLTYYILIEGKSLHYIRKNCTKESSETIRIFSDREKVSYNFLSAEPDYEYEVEVLAETEAGNSTGVMKRCTTKNSPSTKPLNIKTVLHNYSNHCNNADYNSTLELSWELPCNTNGELSHFEINITENLIIDRRIQNTGIQRFYSISKNGDIRNPNYRLIVENLTASCTYESSVTPVTIGLIHGVPAERVSQRTEDGCPSQPTEIRVHLHDSSFELDWKEPETYYGQIMEYNVVLEDSGPKHTVSKDPSCIQHHKLMINDTTKVAHFLVEKIQPNYAYEYRIAAKTSAGFGNYSRTGQVVTHSKESEPIRNIEISGIEEIITDDKYEYKIQITFKEPCNTNGLFRSYTIEESGKRPGYPDIFVVMNFTDTSLFRILREPEYHFEYTVRVVTESFVSSGVRKAINTSASIPTVDEKKIKCYVNEDSPTNINIALEKGIMNENNGNISRYAIFLFEGELENSNSPKLSSGICNKTCPDVNRTSYPFINNANIYQITPDNWNPFEGGNDKITIAIGKNDDCKDGKVCVDLEEDTHYIVLLRGCTKNTYRDVFISTKTGTKSSSALIFVIPSLVLVLILLLGVYLYSRRSEFFTMRFRSVPSSVIEEPSNLRYAVAVKQFITYYNKIQNDPTLLKKQYEEIDEETKRYKAENVHTTFALKPENKRKNRYTNILPYDEYRVKLNIDEDDEISSDYINASYIKGVTGEVEYIATQGPLEHTCKDFWKMVIQENVTVIVMVSQFVEKEKVKCYKYFPKTHGSLKISEDMEVKCLTELQFDTHCVRTLMIKKDVRQYSVVHMQYLDWPDFGCPTGTYNMITFCEEVRDRIQFEKGLMAVHCSAGVGRTGTLISLDILLQAMRREKDISVFECVMDLRKQRTHMVQTEIQYVYIHTCLKDVLENSSLYSFDDVRKNEEHVYENIKNAKVSVVGKTKCEERESAF